MVTGYHWDDAKCKPTSLLDARDQCVSFTPHSAIVRVQFTANGDLPFVVTMIVPFTSVT